MTNRASSFPTAPAVGPLHRHGGKINALTELPIHAVGDDYILEGNGTVQRLPSLAPGVTVHLKILGTPTFTNSTKLVCSNGVDYVATANALVVERSSGDGVWSVHPIVSEVTTVNSIAALTLQDASSSQDKLTFGVATSVNLDGSSTGPGGQILFTPNASE
jgi:hypothetical protein